MRHPSAWQRVVLPALIVFCAGMSYAGWPSGIWPSETYPREGYGQLSSVWSATWERCSAAGVTLPATPTWHRPGTDFSPNLKGCLKTAIPLYVDGTGISDYTNYFLSVNTNARSLPMWTVTGLMVACKMPTNWLDYTPPRGLSGLGGATNDATVGHPYGYTNEWTVLGGTNYPTGRTKWYSTDYGYGMATNLFSRLLDISLTPGVDVTLGSSAGGIFDKYSTVVSWCRRHYTVASGSSGNRCAGSYYMNGIGANDLGNQNSGSWTYVVTNSYTNVGLVAWVFMNIGPYGGYETGAGPNSEYTNEWVTSAPVSGWEKYKMSLLASQTVEASEGILTNLVFGTTSQPYDVMGFASSVSEKPIKPYASTKGWEWWDSDLLVLRYSFVYK